MRTVPADVYKRQMLYTVNQSRLEGYKQAHDRACCKIDESLLFLELESDDLRTSAVDLAVQRGADCILLSLIHIWLDIGAP